MARIAKVVLQDIAHHVTQRGVRSMNIFYTHENRAIYKELLYTQCKRFGVKILSYLMTNHGQLICTLYYHSECRLIVTLYIANSKKIYAIFIIG